MHASEGECGADLHVWFGFGLVSSGAICAVTDSVLEQRQSVSYH